MDVCAVSIFWLLWRWLLWTCVYLYLFEHLFFILWGIYLEVELWGHMVILCLTYWETTKLFSTMAEPFYIPQATYKGLNFSTSLLVIVHFFFFLIVAILVGWGCISPSFGKFYFWCNHGLLQGLCFLNFALQIYSLNFFPVTFSPTFKSLTHLESPFVFDVR